MKPLSTIKLIASTFALSTVLCLSAFSQATPPARMPANFDAARTDVVHGTMETITYHSTTLGTDRKATVYLPPHYYKTNWYSSLYLLPGIDGDGKRWVTDGHVKEIMDNLYELDKIANFIVIMPDGLAAKDGNSDGSALSAKDKAGLAALEKDLVADLLPAIEKKYPVHIDWQMRAIAGVSTGGAQALNIALANTDKFCWVGAFSPASNVKAGAALTTPDPKIKWPLTFISSGNADTLITYSIKTHDYLNAINRPHIYYIEPGKHNFEVWKNDFYVFAQTILKPYRLDLLDKFVYTKK
ncbi:hypothetical protein GCM10027049_30340 [Mucilaginibacter puniceus]